MDDSPAGPDAARASSRGSTIWRTAGVAALVLVLVLGVARFMKQGVVTGWRLLATCTVGASTQPPAVETALRTDTCATPPVVLERGRGWPIVAFVLPPSAGVDPRIRAVRLDRGARTMSVEYEVQGDGRGSGPEVVAFVEVPPGQLPDTPFAVRGAHGLVVVDSLPAQR